MGAVCRFDIGELVGSVSKTPEGYLRGIARVTRTGVFNYKNSDGSSRRELRHPDEVFKADSLNTLKQIPITNGHPASKLVNSDTAKELSVGFTGENIQPDGKFILIPITITAQDGVDAVNSGRRELSLGYEVELEPQPSGRFDGVEYDFVQRNIVYNHLALVDRGRAGTDVRLHLDHMDTAEINEIPTIKEEKRMEKTKLDGIEYEAAPEVIKALEKANAQIVDFQKRLDGMVVEADKLRADADTSKALVAQLQSRDIAGEIAAAVKSRGALVAAAVKVLDGETVAKIDSMSDAEIKSAVIARQFPEVKLDGVSPDYLQARFDSAVVLLSSSGSAAAAQRKVVQDSKDGTKKEGSEEARQRYIDRMTGAYKGDACGAKPKA